MTRRSSFVRSLLRLHASRAALGLLACGVLAGGLLGVAEAGTQGAERQPATIAGVASEASVFHLVGQGEEAVVRRYGEPEQVTEYQAIYNLPGQRPLRWMFYQREALLVGVDRSGTVTAVLLLPSYHRALPGGLRLEMRRGRVQQLLGRPDHAIEEDGGTRRLIYVRQALDLTFDGRSDTLVQVLYYPALRKVAAQLSRQAAASGQQASRPSPPPAPRPTPTPTPRPTPTPKPRPTPTPKPRPTPTPKPRPTPTPSPRAALKARALPPVSAMIGKSGSASVVGLVSYFRTDAGDIQYLHGVQFYVAAEPLDATLRAGGRQVPRAQWEVIKLRHRARIWDLIRTGKIVSGIESDRFGRFKFQALPAGSFHLIGIYEDSGRYMVWQRPLTLAANRQLRTYLNRNNVSLSSQ